MEVALRGRESTPGATVAAIEDVYRARHAELLRVATAIIGDAEVARDAVQEGLARALARRKTFRGAGSIDAWLWKVIVNAARNAVARAPRFAPSVDSEAPPESDADHELRAVVAALPERQRLVLFLRYYADLDYEAIAQALGVRRGTVSATLSQAHASLRRCIEEVPVED
jgi:RNA polymerase sigma factor (sigma-70 family)